MLQFLCEGRGVGVHGRGGNGAVFIFSMLKLIVVFGLLIIVIMMLVIAMLIVIEWLSLLLRINIYCKYMVILVISIHKNNLLQQQL